MNEKLLDNLYAVLKTEYEYYQKLNDFASEKKEAIIENDVEKLTEIIEKEKDIIAEINQLEDKRDNLLAEFNSKVDLDTEQLNYSQLVENISQKWETRLGELREKLLNIIDELHQKNEENKSLINEAIKLNNFSFKMMTRLLNPDSNTYNPDDKGEDSSNHIMDRRA
ncbi:MAG: flagellar protein FlgN [Halanaerobiaceae bacterium]